MPVNPAIPTHLYKIVTRCESNTTSEYEIEKCSGTIRVISFILRHTKEHCKVSVKISPLYLNLTLENPDQTRTRVHESWSPTCRAFFNTTTGA
jgi:hypothetical protein